MMMCDCGNSVFNYTEHIDNNVKPLYATYFPHFVSKINPWSINNKL